MKTTRRSFLQQLGLMSAAAFWGLNCEKNENPKLGLILYTIRDLLKDDFMGTLESVATIGYSAVEFAGFYDHTAQQVRKKLDELGLAAISSHEGFDLLQSELDKVIEYNLALGNPNIVCPSMPHRYMERGLDGIKRFSDEMNRIGEKVKQAGMQFHYHNHAYEFEKIEGSTILELLLESTESRLVKAQFDVYWIKRGGADPSAIIGQYADRCSLVHMKDLADDQAHSDVPVGTGILDIRSIISACRKANVEWCIVEQDNTKRPPLEAIEISYKNMKTLLTS